MSIPFSLPCNKELLVFSFICGNGTCRAFLPSIFNIHPLPSLSVRPEPVFRAVAGRVAKMWRVLRIGLCLRYCMTGTVFGSVIKERKALFLRDYPLLCSLSQTFLKAKTNQ